MKVLGITGPIGCGKSTVARLTVELGAAERIDADLITHELLSTDASVITSIAEEFGQSVVTADQKINRAALGRIVFADETMLRRLESIVHPAVRNVIASRISHHAQSNDVVTVEAIKLLQSPISELTDEIWTIVCSFEIQQSRLRNERRMEPDAIANRIAVSPALIRQMFHESCQTMAHMKS